jgi:hypothetical protein
MHSASRPAAAGPTSRGRGVDVAEGSEQRLAKMTERFLGRPREELMNDEEFLSLTQDELRAPGARG